MRFPCFATALLAAAQLCAQVATNKPSPSEPRPSMESMALPGHGSLLLGVFYLAAGTGPNPTAILFHGFPGFEQNLDLAQALRSHGWNVLAMHYRGSWGVKGDFSFQHAIEDADAEVQFVLAPENAKKYRIDTRRVVVIGHSMGGYMAVSAAAHNPTIAAAVLISAWNIGSDYELQHRPGSAPMTMENEAKALGHDNNLLPLTGTSGIALAEEIQDHKAELNFLNLAPAIASRPFFVITSKDRLAPTGHELVQALQNAGDSRVTERHWDTDHSYSGERTELASAIIGWLDGNMPKAAE